MAHVERMFYGETSPTPQASPRRDPWRKPASPEKHSSQAKRESSKTDPQYTTQSLPRRKPVASLQQPEFRLHDRPNPPVSITLPPPNIQEPQTAFFTQTLSDRDSLGSASPEPNNNHYSLPTRSRHVSGPAIMVGSDQVPRSIPRNMSPQPPHIEESGDESFEQEENPQSVSALQYHAFDDLPKPPEPNRSSHRAVRSLGSSSSGGDHRPTGSSQQLDVPRTTLDRPTSAYTLGSELRGRTLSPLSANGSDGTSPHPRSRDSSGARRSPSARPVSYVELLANVPHSQQIPPGPHMNNVSLQSAVGSAASLLDTKKTLDMYRANVKKTNDAAVQYEFAIFMLNASRDATPEDGLDAQELVSEAKHILQRLSDRAYPFAQYYLGDGYFSGLFSKGKQDYDKAFPLFVGASKHGHAEAGYRAGLCYEFGWGTTKSYPKAVQFYRNSASKNHPGAATRLGLACIRGDMGLGRDKYREGVKWLKRATESADFQYNTAPYELGLMHLSGHGDDIFKDEAYAAQLFTQAADLGHAEANLLMGRAYENGLYGLPRDAALSVHFYNGAAMKGHVEGMMALCAWYMVGAEPVLEKDEVEAYAWALQAAETGEWIFFGFPQLILTLT